MCACMYVCAFVRVCACVCLFTLKPPAPLLLFACLFVCLFVLIPVLRLHSLIELTSARKVDTDAQDMRVRSNQSTKPKHVNKAFTTCAYENHKRILS